MKQKQPNILFIMTDDHAAHAMSCYGSKVNETPQMDRLANMGARFDNCFCTNSICAPSRGVILTGKNSHLNGVKTLEDGFDGRQQTLPKLLQAGGYQTSIIGKWHLGHGGNYDPTGFDYWNIFPGQGQYINPKMYDMGELKQYTGYATDIVTDLTIDWIKNRNKDKPFFMMCHHKAPHRHWVPDEKHKDMYEDIDIPLPDTFNDSHEGRSDAVKYNLMGIEELTEFDLKQPFPEGLTDAELKYWKYQRYMKDYLKCIASVDDNIGRLLDFLEEEGLKEDTIVVYTSDQGFFLGDHGWFDKRYMLEESLRMPFLMSYPGVIKEGSVITDLVANLDFAETFLDYAGLEIPEDMQGHSFKPILEGNKPKDWLDALYYRYWVYKGEHGVSPHYGIRTLDYKLICYLKEARDFSGNCLKEVEDKEWPQWELFDLRTDSEELDNVYDDVRYQDVVKELKRRLFELKEHYQDYED